MDRAPLMEQQSVYITTDESGRAALHKPEIGSGVPNPE
jgi:hypothetical protein